MAPTSTSVAILDRTAALFFPVPDETLVMRALTNSLCASAE
jgi:hypothetical protein